MLKESIWEQFFITHEFTCKLPFTDLIAMHMFYVKQCGYADIIKTILTDYDTKDSTTINLKWYELYEYETLQMILIEGKKLDTNEIPLIFPRDEY